jgi:transcriptional regulator with XRE-family HTH domain
VYTQSQLAGQLKSKDYRDAFVGSLIRIGLPMQCRALRESREWTQPQLAEAAGMSQPRISEIERPGERKLNLETLLRLASAFDVALQVRFVPFSKLIDDDDSVDFSDFYVEPFEEDFARVEQIEEKMKSVAILKPKESGLIRALMGEGLRGEVKREQPDGDEKEALRNPALKEAMNPKKPNESLAQTDDTEEKNNAAFSRLTC